MIEIFSRGIGDSPKPGRSGAITRWESMKAGMLSSQFCHVPDSPCTNTIAGLSAPPVSITLTSRPSTVTRRVIDGQSTDIQVASSPSA